ncbi:Fc.00g055670.m01.CDS01 [Cosmosporella sp. VM-42]
MAGFPVGDVEPVEEETADYFDDLFDESAISNEAATDVQKVKCNGASFEASADCLGSFYGAFGDIVEDDEAQGLLRNFTREGILSEDEIKGIITGALRRTIRTSDSMCGSYTFNFQWTGVDGNCNLACSEAFENL